MGQQNRTFIFIESESGDRTNIISNFKVLDRENFIKSLLAPNTNRYSHPDYRYSVLNGRADNVKYMSLKEFEEIFSDNLSIFPPETVTRHFRKEISEVYGEHKIRKEKKVIPSKDLVKGGVYLDAKGDMHLYLGDVIHTTEHVYVARYNKQKDDSVISGKGWLQVWNCRLDRLRDDSSEILKAELRGLSVLKTNRKMTEFTGEILELPESITWTRNGHWRNNESLDDKFEETIEFKV